MLNKRRTPEDDNADIDFENILTLDNGKVHIVPVSIGYINDCIIPADIFSPDGVLQKKQQHTNGPQITLATSWVSWSQLAW